MILQTRLISNELDGLKILDNPIGSIFLVDIDDKDICIWENPITKNVRPVTVIKELQNDDLIPMECLELIY